MDDAVELERGLSLLPRDAEVIVADGGSLDGSPEVARARGVRCVSLPGLPRGAVLNAGAAASSGDILAFVHADTRLPPDAVRLMVETATGRGVAAGAFSLSFGDAGPSLGLIAAGANFRSRWFRLSYGDQVLFLRREVFFKIGGFPDWPLLEDVGIVRRLRGAGRLVIRPERVVTSPRRYRRLGPWRTAASNMLTLTRFALGASPWTLARGYSTAARG